MRVLIAEDAVLLRAGITRLLVDAGEEVVAAVGDAPALVDAVERLRPDLAVVDVRMPPTMTDDGIRAAVAVRARHPEVGILVLSQYVEERYATDLLSAGSDGIGYLLKDRVADVADFVDAARRVAAGGTALDPEVVAQLLARSRSRDPLERLTRREREVLGLMAEGRSNTAIAKALVVGDGGRGEARELDLHQARSRRHQRRQPPGPGRAALARPGGRDMSAAGPRRGWLAAGAVAAVAAIAVGTVQVVGLLAHDEERRRDVVTAPIRHVDVRSGAGGVRLERSADGSTVIEQRLVHSLARPRSTFRVDGDRLVVDTSCRRPFTGRCAVHLVLAVPDGAVVTARVSGGGIRSAGVDGPLHLRSTGGGITVSGGRGPIDVESTGGGVRVDGTAASRVSADASGGGVRLVFSAPPAEVEASSRGGGVTVEVPSDPTAYRVDARSRGGGTNVDVRTDPLAERRITVRASGGGVTVRYPQQQ